MGYGSALQSPTISWWWIIGYCTNSLGWVALRGIYKVLTTMDCYIQYTWKIRIEWGHPRLALCNGTRTCLLCGTAYTHTHTHIHTHTHMEHTHNLCSFCVALTFRGTYQLYKAGAESLKGWSLCLCIKKSTCKHSVHHQSWAIQDKVRVHKEVKSSALDTYMYMYLITESDSSLKIFTLLPWSI